MILPWRKVHPPACKHPLPQILSSLTHTEAAVLAGLAAGKIVLEIGAAFGFSTITMAKTADYLVSVDFHEHMPSLADMLANLLEYGVADRVRVLVDDSRIALPKLLSDGDRFDLVFIDGDHSESGVRYDAELGCAILRPGGLLAFHDYGEHQCPNVKPTVDSMFKCPTAVYDTLFIVRPDDEIKWQV